MFDLVKKNTFKTSTQSHACCLHDFLVFFVALVVASIGTSSAFAQVEPGAIEPIIIEQDTLEQEPSPLDEVEPTPSPESGTSSTETNNSEIKIPLDAIGLSYLPENHNLAQDVVISLQSQVRDFSVANDGLYTLGELNDFAVKLTRYLRSQGYALSSVFVPAQKVDARSMVFQVVPGSLSKVDAVESRLYSVADLESLFDKRIEQPVNANQLEQSLLLMNDLPGLSARGSFSPGQRTGFTNMRLAFAEQDKLESYVRLDNYNVESTGDLRFLAGVSVNNITGNRDSLDVDVIQTFDKGDLTNASAQYQIFSPNLRHRFGGRYSQSSYDTESASFNAQGDTYLGEVFWRAAWQRSSTFNLSTKTSLAVKRAERLALSELEDERLTVFGLALSGDNADKRLNGLNGFNIGYYRGFNSTIGSQGDGDDLQGEFEKWQLTLQRLQSLGSANRLRLRLAGQFTKDTLSSLEKINLGGPYSVRALALGIASGERSKFASVEWNTDWFPFANSNAHGEYTWREVLDVSLFVDYGQVSIVGLSDATDKEEAAGAGFALRASDPNSRWRAELSAAVPFQDKDRFGNDFDSEQIWFSLSGFF